ncbi:MAG: PhnA domain-containing protein [Proteobacteria bacterium]|nr:PhnA domain-containing protein [Pseudomonadota bacterium]
MDITAAVYGRSESKCELCSKTIGLGVYEVPPATVPGADGSLLVCETCREQIETPETMEAHHWRCLNDSMWSQVPAVQVMAWRMLNRLKKEGWPQDLLDMLYLDEDTLTWARATNEGEEDQAPRYLDCNGVELASGDTVTVIKDLDVKGTTFTAKRGTAVRGISLVTGNHEQIEGRVNGQQIVILTKFVKKSK